jgi:adenylate cyclase
MRPGPIKDSNTAARIWWEKALVLDPNSAALNAMLGFLHVVDARFGWWDDRETALAKGRAYADRALELDSGNADAHITSGCVSLFRGQYEEAVAVARRAVELAPGSADVASNASFILTPSGPEEAAIHSEKAIALSPHSPVHCLGMLGDAYRKSGRAEQAIAGFKACHARNPEFGLTDLEITYQQMGRAEDAQHTAAQLMIARPALTISGWLKTQFIRRDRRESTRMQRPCAPPACQPEVRRDGRFAATVPT